MSNPGAEILKAEIEHQKWLAREAAKYKESGPVREILKALAGLAFIVFAFMMLAIAALADGRPLIINGELPANASGPAIAKYCTGGTGARAVAFLSKEFIADGPAYSACAWIVIAAPKGCYTPKAVLGFHGWHDPGTGAPMKVGTEWWLAQVSARIKGKLGNILTGKNLVKLAAADLDLLIPEKRCGAKS